MKTYDVELEISGLLKLKVEGTSEEDAIMNAKLKWTHSDIDYIELAHNGTERAYSDEDDEDEQA
jgi:hypothetical protein